MPLHRFSYYTLRALKWPLALLSLVFFPSMAWALWSEILLDIGALAFVFLGATAYGALWWLSIRKWSLSWLSTFEHEMTHCLFAWLTGNRVGEIKVTLRGGGHITVIGSPNWLIDVAPYFFPTATIVLLLISTIIPYLDLMVWQLAIGVSLCYHFTSTIPKTHEGQTDLQKAGFVFCWMFLPTANIVGLGLTLAIARNGWTGVSQWLSAVTQAPWNTTIFQWVSLWATVPKFQ
jgi:hypothetical protein